MKQPNNATCPALSLALLQYLRSIFTFRVQDLTDMDERAIGRAIGIDEVIGKLEYEYELQQTKG